jgi:hypothetical protein
MNQLILALIAYSCWSCTGELVLWPPVGQRQPELPLTVAEESEFKSTSTSAQVVEFMRQCDDAAPHVKSFVFGRTVEDRDMVGTVIAHPVYELGQRDDRAVVLVIGNIHSGEVMAKRPSYSCCEIWPVIRNIPGWPI